MKLRVLALIICHLSGCSSQEIPPIEILARFTIAYPGITVEHWDMVHGKYKARFTKDGRKMCAFFGRNGELNKTEMYIPITELPAAISVYVQMHYKGSIIKEAAVVTRPNGEKSYEAEIKGKDLLFNKYGKLIKKEED